MLERVKDKGLGSIHVSPFGIESNVDAKRELVSDKASVANFWILLEKLSNPDPYEPSFFFASGLGWELPKD